MACRGPAHRGRRQKVQRAHPGQKALGRSQSVGGPSGQVPVHGKSPSTSELHSRRGPWREDQGSDCEERQRSNTPKKGCTTARNHWAVTQQSSQLRTLLLHLVYPFPLPPRLTRASASKEPLRSSQKPSEACAGTPRAQSMCGLPVVSRGKDAKKHPFGTRVILRSTASSDIPDTTTCVQTRQTYCCCQTPRHSTGRPRQSRGPREGHLHGARHRPRLRLLSLTQPTELPVIVLGTRRGHAPGSVVPPESAGERNLAGDNPSRCACCKAGC